MKILAIDPGTTKSGWVLMGGKWPIDYGWFDNKKIYTLLRMYQSVVVIEDVAHYGMPVGRDVFETIRWTGRFDYLAESLGLEVRYITRPEVKLALCGSPRANDSTIRQALIDRFGGDEVAIGGKKCKECKGKGWNGRGRELCTDCHHEQERNVAGVDMRPEKGCGYQSHPGPLHGISGHVWSALGVGLTYFDTVRE